MSDALDKWFPTAVRYVGLLIMVYATVIDNLERPSLIVAATGMILFKNVYHASEDKSSSS